jgi:3'-5' exoribonuclease
MELSGSEANRNTGHVKMVFVSDLEPGREVEDAFLLAEAEWRQAKNGPFWNLLLEDRTGQVPCKIFHPHSQAAPRLEAGMTVKIRGQVGLWRDMPQVIADRVEVLDPAAHGLDPADYAQASERDPRDMLVELERILDGGLRHKPWRKLLRRVLKDPEIRERLASAPGGKSIHHAYIGGLIEHTLAVVKLCVAFCELYDDLDRELLLAAAVLHDLGKAWEYGRGPVREVTDEGRLLGHIHLGFEVLEPHFAKAKDLDPDLITHLKHVILAHHGQYEYGSPKLPMTAEAMALHFADNLDSKLNTCAGAFAEHETDSGPGWSAYQRSMERFLYRPARTPGADAGKKKDDKGNQCLLPLKE